MKRIKLVQSIGMCLFVVYLILFILDLIWGVLYELDTIVFSMFLALISLSMIAKGVLLKSSSTLWFAINLILSAIFILVLSIAKKDFKDYYQLLSLIPLVATIINWIIFRYNIYIKLFILNVSITIPIFILKIYSFELWQNVAVFIVSLIIGIFIGRSIDVGKEKV